MEGNLSFQEHRSMPSLKEWGKLHLTLLTSHFVIVLIWHPHYFLPYQGIFTQIMETLSELCDLTNDGGHHSTELHQNKNI